MRVSVAGLGWWGRALTDAILRSELLELVSVCDSGRGRNNDFAESRGVELAPGFEALLDDPRLDGVVIATPNSQHASQAVAAARNGKHVFVEKPIALTFEGAQAVVNACTEAHVCLGVGHERRFDAPVRALLRSIESGDLGVPVHFEANVSQDAIFRSDAKSWRVSETEAPAGPLTATVVHLTDLAVAVMGSAETLDARLGHLGGGFPNGDMLAVAIGFSSGATGLIASSLTSPYFGRVAVFGNAGWVEIRDQGHPQDARGWRFQTSFRSSGAVEIEMPGGDSVQENLEAFARAAAQTEPYAISVEEILWNAAVVEATLESVRLGSRVFVPGGGGGFRGEPRY